jgi:hypothetical protein
MTSPRLTSERVTQLADEIAMLSFRRVLGLVGVQSQQIASALWWHRQSCRPLQVARRLCWALASKRLSTCLALIASQKAMLRMAADEACDEGAVLDALVALYDSLVQFDLGPNATSKERLALEVCRVPEVRLRYAHLVRTGQIGTTPDGLALASGKRRRIAGYSMLAMFTAWPSLVFVTMALNGALNVMELAGYFAASLAMSALLTRGLFVQLDADERTVRSLNEQLKPRSVHRDGAQK